MKMNYKKTILLVTLLIMLVGIVNATEVSDDTLTYEDTPTESFQSYSTAASIAENSVTTEKENKEIKKIGEKKDKTDNNELNPSNYTELVNMVDNLKSVSGDEYSIDLSEGNYNATQTITWGNSTQVKTLTINGNGLTIDGQDEYQFMIIDEDYKLILNNITLTNFKSTENGGAINNNGELILNHCIFLQNKADEDLGYGGAIYNEGYLTITSSDFEENTANDGGAIYNIGTLSITDSTFYSNSFETICSDSEYDFINSSNDENEEEGSENGDEGSENQNVTTIIDFDVDNIEFGDEITISGIIECENEDTLSDIELDVNINGDSNTTTTNEWGEFSYSFTPETTGTYNITVSYAGDGYYLGSNSTKNVTVSQSDTEISLDPFDPVLIGDTITIYGTLTNLNLIEIDNATIIIQINNKKIPIKTENGEYFYEYVTDTVGTNNITVTFPGDKNYRSSNISDTFTVEKQDTNIEIDPIYLSVYGEEISITGILTDSNYDAISNATIKLTYNNKESRLTTNNNGEFILNIKIDTVGTNNVSASYEGSAVYNSIKTGTDFDVIPANTYITVNQVNTTKVTNNVTITGALKTTDDDPITNAPLTIKVNNNNYTTKTNEKGVYFIQYKTNTVGRNNVTITYAGNKNYESYDITTTFTVNKINTLLMVNTITDKKYGEQVTITGTLKDEKTNNIKDATITITYNNATYTTSTDDTGTYKYTLTAKTIGTNTVKVQYEGNNVYNKNSTQVKYSTRKLKSSITINSISGTKYGNNLTITGTLKDENNKLLSQEVKLKVNKKTYTLTTSDKGIFTQTITADTIGTNNVTITYNGNTTITGNNAQKTFTVTKQDQTITIKNIATTAYAENITITGKLTDKNGKAQASTNIKVTLNKATVTVKTDNNGEYKYTTQARTLGTNNITVTQEGNTKYNSVTSKKTFTVTKQDTILENNKIASVRFTDSVNITGKLTDKNGKGITSTSVTLKINDKTVTTKTNNAGVYNYKYMTEKVGNNNVTVSFAGNTYYKPASTKTTFDVTKQKTDITLNSIKAAYSDNITISGKLTDSNARVIGNVDVKLKINGKTVTVKTDKNGIFKYKYQTNIVGINNLTATFNGNSQYSSNSISTTFKVEKLDLILTVSRVRSVAYGENITIQGTFKDKNGKILGNTILRLNINGKAFKIKTNTKGTYTKKVTANKTGINTINITYNGNKNYNKIVTNTTVDIVKQNLTITVTSNRTVGYGSKVFINGKLANKQGKVIKNTVITINVNGKIIRAKTNSKGLYNHSLTTNKLGTNNITVTYAGNKNYNMVSKKVTFTVTKQNVKISVSSIKQEPGTTKATITGKLTNIDGKALQNSNVILVINGAKKSVKTNNKGVYTLTVKAKKGNNTLVPTFAANTYYNKYTGAKKTFTII